MKMTVRPRPQLSRRRSGFTLMEILIVLAILAVIIGLVLPNFLGAQDRANKDAAKVAVAGVEKAADIYAAHHDGTFPASLDALLANPGGDDKWSGPYLDKGKVPNDPWGNPIQYAYPGTHQNGQDRPDVWSMGKDKQSNTADDVANWGK
ncbi:MAG: type II secretion system major pseudopilin GspG [Planctomycetes bacterium]|nr:type II secretion system major pseudopilin GspG [Planctomycetota bacterium]